MNRTRLKYYLRALGIGIIVTALLMGYSQKPPQMSDEEILRRAAELELEGQREVLADLATATPEPENSLESDAAISAESTASPVPGPTVEPAAGTTPKPMVEPGASATPKPTAEPAVSPTPKPTEEPVASPTPKPTEEPVASPTPKPTEEPVASSTPKPTEEPAVSPTPKPTEEPTVSPAPAGDVAILVISRGESSMTVSRNLQELGLVEDYRAFDRFLCDNGYDHSISTGTHEIPLGATYEEIAGIICKIR
ncbi:putative hemoglobin and hemoglobin-haptoglobin-binding protein 3 [Lachnospiraceae bacterium]|nr:hypothetical protein [Acetatifactor sp.]GFH95951.1 putative hemoglobin and hemoglobin-haptoglobin-binding protein 3 [Lachnospiraceae bacterium]